MNDLEQWIARCISIPIDEFPEGDEDEVGDENEPVEEEEEWHPSPLYMFLHQAPSDLHEVVSEDLLIRLHSHVRNQPCEHGVWDSVIMQVSNPLPDFITNDLIDRRIVVTQLGHRHQSEAILRRLAPLVSEALLSLAGELYRNPERSLEEFVEILDQYPNESWMYSHLAHGVASSPEKLQAFLKRVEGTPQWQQALDSQASHEHAEQEKREHQHRMERARATTNADEIRALYEVGDFHVVLTLVRNPATPLEVLTSVSQLKSMNFQGAAQLRHEAKNALYRRNQKEKRQCEWSAMRLPSLSRTTARKP
jgi:hypothetical protein